jgi:uncharacterized protein (DUF736 family)
VEYDNTNRGTLFKAKEKKGERSPDYTGSININGVEMRLSAWLKESKAGTKYFSLAVSEKDGQYQGTSNARPRSEGRSDGNASHVDDDIPF